MPDYDKELEDLEALLASPGWERFMGYVSLAWGNAAFRQRAHKILVSLTDGTQRSDAANLLLQLEYASDEIEKLFKWVPDRVSQLKRLREGGAGGDGHAPTR